MATLLNIDLGELPDEPEELYALAQIANIACGGHAGDAASMARACACARRHGALVAAHPSYPDREGFGRRSLAIPRDELLRSITEQCAALRDAAGQVVYRVKAHGALYHDLARDPALAASFIEAASAGLGVPVERLEILGPASLAVGQARLLREGFADRGLDADGSILPRSAPGALLTMPAEAAAQAVRLAASGQFDTLCVHSDTPDAVTIARAVRAVLAAG